MSTRAKAFITALLLLVGMAPAAGGPLAEPMQAGTFTVTASLNPKEILLGESAILSGLVSPVRTGTKVRIQQKKPSGWVTIAKSSMGADGSYGYSLTPTRVGTFVYRARMPNVGSIVASSSPRRKLTVVEDAVTVFTIPPGTGAGSWNASDNPVMAQVGDTLRIVNGDSVPHRLHTDGEPFAHPAADLAPGQAEEYVLQSSFAGALYCHTHGFDSKFWITVTP